MIPLYIDTKDVFESYNVTPQQVEAFVDFVVKEITAAFAERWEGQANIHLKQTRQRYKANLKVVDTGRMTGAVVLDYSKDKLVKMLEEGAGAFDIKDGMAKSDKRKIKADGAGWYIHIPFRVGTPGALGESNLFAYKMPEIVYKAVQQVPQVTKTAGLREVPAPYNVPQTRAAVTSLGERTTFEEYKHKGSIYEGIHKVTDPVTRQNIYMNFRTISDTSDPVSWIHSGINAYNLADKAMTELENDMEHELNRATNRGLAQMGIF